MEIEKHISVSKCGVVSLKISAQSVMSLDLRRSKAHKMNYITPRDFSELEAVFANYMRLRIVYMRSKSLFMEDVVSNEALHIEKELLKRH